MRNAIRGEDENDEEEKESETNRQSTPKLEERTIRARWAAASDKPNEIPRQPPTL